MSIVLKRRKIHLIILEIRFSITLCYYLQSTYILFYFEANKEYYFYYVLLLFYIFIKYSFIDTKNSDYYHWKNVTISPIACTMKTSKYATRSNKIINCNIINISQRRPLYQLFRSHKHTNVFTDQLNFPVKHR